MHLTICPDRRAEPCGLQEGSGGFSASRGAPVLGPAIAGVPGRLRLALGVWGAPGVICTWPAGVLSLSHSNHPWGAPGVISAVRPSRLTCLCAGRPRASGGRRVRCPRIRFLRTRIQPICHRIHFVPCGGAFQRARFIARPVVGQRGLPAQDHSVIVVVVGGGLRKAPVVLDRGGAGDSNDRPRLAHGRDCVFVWKCGAGGVGGKTKVAPGIRRRSAAGHRARARVSP